MGIIIENRDTVVPAVSETSYGAQYVTVATESAAGGVSPESDDAVGDASVVRKRGRRKSK